MINIKDILNISSNADFKEQTLKVFKFQAENCDIYKRFLNFLNINPNEINSIEEIPFMPISFFKSFKILTQVDSYEKIFTSSGTTGENTSRHFVHQLSVYHKELDAGFKHFFGNYEDYHIFSLLPAYAERTGSSLIEMVEYWKKQTKQPASEHYLYNHKKLYEDLLKAQSEKKKIILIGVSFALIDFAESFPFEMKNTILIETGGMKGRKKEITREELHSILKDAFKLDKIYSEYGMTELLSQAYSTGEQLFSTPPWMRILLRDTEDPLSLVPHGKTGGINVIDLANLYSCSFIATDDLGRMHDNNQFEILGRFDNSDVRGCNLMVVG
ncbi:acyl transferase [Weeksellaceae bacterium TAE3-ERU29]|nr:acyl transferase [Weeksellaceae bacterium TAE3-ERU29]